MTIKHSFREMLILCSHVFKKFGAVDFLDKSISIYRLLDKLSIEDIVELEMLFYKKDMGNITEISIKRSCIEFLTTDYFYKMYETYKKMGFA